MCKLLSSESIFTNYPLHFLKILRHVRVCGNNKKPQPVKIFLVEGWSVEGSVTKVIKQIVMDFGLLILHKTKVLIL